MRLSAAFLAEEVTVRQGVYLDIKGGLINRLQADGYPANLEVPLVIVLEQVPGEDQIEGSLEVEVLDTQGVVQGPIYHASVAVAERDGHIPIGLLAYGPTALPLNLQLPEPGTYNVQIRLDGEVVGRVPFHAGLA